MLARTAAGVAGLVAVVAPIPLLFMPVVVLDGAVTNECFLDGGADDCYGAGLRLLLVLWGLTGLAAVAACAYAGGSGVYYALTGRRPPRLGLAVVAAAVLLTIAWFPLLPLLLG
ncbi:MAG TPA: hypothetical protein VF715_18205 [Thermoleophilaceae bacterium]